MAVRATHVPTSIDITVSPYADETSQAVMAEVHGHCLITDGVGVLECREHDNDPRLAHHRSEDGRVHGAWMYLRKLHDKWVICHSPHGVAAGLGNHEVPVGKSSQHQWQQDYYARAASDAGWDAQQEVTLPGTRADLILTGPAGRFAVEVQHSGISVPGVRTRSRKMMKVGIPSIWSADHKNPAWAFKVPHVETNEPPYGSAPRGSWTVSTGPRRIRPTRCTPGGDMARCWKPRARAFCNGWHATFEPIAGLRVDDIAARVPAGELIPLDTHTKQGVILTTRADRAMWAADFAEQVAARIADDSKSASSPCGYTVQSEYLTPAHLIEPPLHRPRPCPACGLNSRAIVKGQCFACRLRADGRA